MFGDKWSNTSLAYLLPKKGLRIFCCYYYSLYCYWPYVYFFLLPFILLFFILFLLYCSSLLSMYGCWRYWSLKRAQRYPKRLCWYPRNHRAYRAWISYTASLLFFSPSLLFNVWSSYRDMRSQMRRPVDMGSYHSAYSRCKDFYFFKEQFFPLCMQRCHTHRI